MSKKNVSIGAEEQPKLEDPKAAVLEPEPGPDNLPPTDSDVAIQAAALGLSIVEAKRIGGRLYITVEGPSIEMVSDIESRKLAYDARFVYGFENSGISPISYEPTTNGKYRQVWELNRGIM